MRDNIARLVLARLSVDQTRPAMGDEAVSLTRAQLLREVRDQARALVDQGIGAGDYVVIVGGRGIRYWVDVFAAWVVGAVAVCVEETIEAAHGAAVLDLTSATHVLAAGVATPESFAGLTEIAAGPEAPTDTAPVALSEIPFAADVPDLAGIIFTSGTTGLPKPVPLSHRALLLNALGTGERLRLNEDDRLLTATPYRFISSISHILVTLMSGASYWGIERRLMIKDLLDVLNGLEITAFGGSPFHMQYIAMAGAERLPHLTWAMSSGDHLRTEVIDQILEKFPGFRLHVAYGMAELGGRFCMLPPERLADKKGSVGFPINGLEIVVLDEDRTPCPPGEIGDVHVRGHIAFTGYLGREDENAKVLSEHGFLNGDKGYADTDGFIFLAGRSDSVFKRSGLKVSAQVIADALLDLDAVRDAWVTGLADDTEGMVPVAYIAWEGDALAQPDLLKALRAELAPNHLPAKVVTLPEIPRTGSGKVDRRRLRALAEDAGT